MSLCFKTVLRAGKINFIALKTFKNYCPDIRTVYYGLVLTWAGGGFTAQRWPVILYIITQCCYIVYFALRALGGKSNGMHILCSKKLQGKRLFYSKAILKNTASQPHSLLFTYYFLLSFGRALAPPEAGLGRAIRCKSSPCFAFGFAGFRAFRSYPSRNSSIRCFCMQGSSLKGVILFLLFIFLLLMFIYYHRAKKRPYLNGKIISAVDTFVFSLNLKNKILF